jgi:hypothetical protein
VPEGAILWSPQKLRLPSSNAGTTPGTSLKLAAMALKSQYIAGRRGSEFKPAYRELQLKAEMELTETAAAPPSAYTMEALHYGIAAEWLSQRRQNVQALASGCSSIRGLQPLFAAWPSAATPFALVLICESRGDRDAFRTGLRERNIYCPIHWEVDGGCATAAELASRLLTVPADQRYGAEDVHRVLHALFELSTTLRIVG